MMMMMVSISWSISCSAQNFGLNKISSQNFVLDMPMYRLDRYCLITGINNSLSPPPTLPTPTTSLCFIVSVCFLFCF